MRGTTELPFGGSTRFAILNQIALSVAGSHGARAMIELSAGLAGTRAHRGASGLSGVELTRFLFRPGYGGRRAGCAARAVRGRRR